MQIAILCATYAPHPWTAPHLAPSGPHRAPCALGPPGGVGASSGKLLLTCRVFALFPGPERASPVGPLHPPGRRDSASTLTRFAISAYQQAQEAHYTLQNKMGKKVARHSKQIHGVKAKKNKEHKARVCSTSQSSEAAEQSIELAPSTQAHPGLQEQLPEAASSGEHTIATAAQHTTLTPVLHQ